MIGWFRRQWWLFRTRRIYAGSDLAKEYPGDPLGDAPDLGVISLCSAGRYNDLCHEMHTLMHKHDKAIKAKKKRSHIEARMKEIRTELLRMEAGK